jgi:hypothetical protein
MPNFFVPFARPQTGYGAGGGREGGYCGGTSRPEGGT